MNTVAIYARYSTDMQREASIEDQIRLCTERAEKEGWQVAGCYSDHGISGASLIRPGVQGLLSDARAHKFDIVLAESIDRLSRDQEDIAHIYKRMGFEDVRIVTLSEGEVNELHIGLKGTMGALFLKDLADKTRRGMRGRVEAGKSGGGNAYGYDVVRKVDANGEAVRGDRKINGVEAGVVRRIFNEYANGKSPRALAHTLNNEKIPGPSGKGWGPSTINGNRHRGTGILNNEIYIGRLIWNRLRYIKDPETGKRVSRLNDKSEWVIHDVPELRIIDQDLWDQVKARQGALKACITGKNSPGMWDRRRPRYLFSGLMKCGVCGDGAIQVNSERIGCAAARNKGTCDNLLTIRRDDLEALVLDGLGKHMMDPALTEVFCQHYAQTMNRLVAEHNATFHTKRIELDKIGRDLDKLVQAILDGVPGNQVKAKMNELESRKELLQRQLLDVKEMPVLLHPNMAGYYREKIEQLREALSDENMRGRAVEVVRSLIERIELTPIGEEGKQVPSISLQGRLAGILALATDKQKPSFRDGFDDESIKLVAGVGFEPTTFRL
ncbi:recombinase family protein [uncultured Sneathiella sp.]|uniref:recombinase family protein n=1 Tax=uncultured Sneathiella sp. TaxID=879315 RepID=UPI0030DC54E0|tara:strand:+ start:6438 stop:8096 length:1659 start_codon:yes stop_codon:yes gene_type:complete